MDLTKANSCNGSTIDGLLRNRIKNQHFVKSNICIINPKRFIGIRIVTRPQRHSGVAGLWIKNFYVVIPPVYLSTLIRRNNQINQQSKRRRRPAALHCALALSDVTRLASLLLRSNLPGVVLIITRRTARIQIMMFKSPKFYPIMHSTKQQRSHQQTNIVS